MSSIGGGGADAIYGGAGNDTITSGGSDVSIDGGAGVDTLKVDRSCNDRPEFFVGPDLRRHGDCHRLRECGCVVVTRGDVSLTGDANANKITAAAATIRSPAGQATTSSKVRTATT